MLKLRRATVVADDPLEVEIDGERRRAWADEGLVGECRAGDEVIVNTAALDLGLGSGGFDVVHVNLTRGVDAGDEAEGVHVMKLNYTSLQHPVDPVEAPADADPAPARAIPVAVIPLHGHLAPLAWAAARAGGDLQIGFIQGAGAALPGSLSRDVTELRERGLLQGHVTAGPSYGGEREAISVTGAMHAAAGELGWDAAIAGPGPGILGSATRYGHGGMAALDTAHAALALGLPTVISPRLSAGDRRTRHVGVSHHTRAVLDLLLAPARVAVPRVDASAWSGEARESELIDACGGRHEPVVADVDLEGYAESGFPRGSMGRDIAEDPLFFAAPLAAGAVLAGLAGTGALPR